MGERPGGPAARRALLRPALVIGGLAVAAAALVGISVSRPEPRSFLPSLEPPEAAAIAAGRSVRVTIDASAPDRWRYFRFSTGEILDVPAAGWDLGVRRFQIMVNGGEGFPGTAALTALGEVDFDTVTLPTAQAFTTHRAVRDSVHPVIARWYRYGFTSHLLTPLPRVWVLRTNDGRHAAFRILSYYCPGPVPGCLTLEYRLLDPPADRAGAAERRERRQPRLSRSDRLHA